MVLGQFKGIAGGSGIWCMLMLLIYYAKELISYGETQMCYSLVRMLV
jgi:hypothetical protein